MAKVLFQRALILISLVGVCLAVSHNHPLRNLFAAESVTLLFLFLTYCHPVYWRFNVSYTYVAITPWLCLWTCISTTLARTVVEGCTSFGYSNIDMAVVSVCVVGTVKIAFPFFTGYREPKNTDLQKARMFYLVHFFILAIFFMYFFMSDTCEGSHPTVVDQRVDLLMNETQLMKKDIGQMIRNQGALSDKMSALADMLEKFMTR